MSAFIKILPMENTAIIVLLVLSVLLVLFAWQFDKHLYIPFLRKMDLQPAKLAEFNPHLLPLGLVIAGCGILFYGVVGWLWLVIK